MFGGQEAEFDENWVRELRERARLICADIRRARVNRNNEIIKAKQDIVMALGETQIEIERLKEKERTVEAVQ